MLRELKRNSMQCFSRMCQWRLSWGRINHPLIFYWINDGKMITNYIQHINTFKMLKLAHILCKTNKKNGCLVLLIYCGSNKICELSLQFRCQENTIIEQFCSTLLTIYHFIKTYADLWDLEASFIQALTQQYFVVCICGWINSQINPYS